MRIEVDADWVDAAWALLMVLLIGAFVVGKLWVVSQRPLALDTSIHWEDYATLAVGLWFLVNAIRWKDAENYRAPRKGMLLFAVLLLISPVTRLILHWTRATTDSWRLAARLLDFAWMCMLAVALVAIGWWFKERIRIV